MKYSKTSLAVAAGLSLALSAQAQQQQQPSPNGEAKVAGIKVGIDPVTGRLRDLTPEESAALSRALVRKRSQADIARYGSAPADNAAAARTVRKSANGSVSVRVPQSAMAELRVRIGSDGQLVVSESEHDDAAARPEVKE